MAQHRLLDELNTGFVANLHRLGQEFLPLTEVRILYPSGAKDVALASHVRKSSILFVAERGSGPSERNGTKDAKSHLVRVKKPLSVKVYMPPHEIEGNMHVAMWQELAQALDGDKSFLAMTDVAVSPATLGGESSFPFVAINKDQILHIGELSEALRRLRQDMKRATPDADRQQAPDPFTSHSL